MVIIEVKPYRFGWKVFEAPGVEPFFRAQDMAVRYAEARACSRDAEIRIMDESGKVERVLRSKGGGRLVS